MRGENPENARVSEREGEVADGADGTERADGAERFNQTEQFNRQELGALLRIFSSLGVTVAAGIAGCFWLGVWAEGRLAAAGYLPGAWLRLAGLLVGLGLSGYWAYCRIEGHLRKFEGRGRGEEK